MKSSLLYVPALICSGICGLAFLGTLLGNPQWCRVVFFAFLPTCFLVMSAHMAGMKREISRLRRRVRALEEEERPDSQRNAGRDVVVQHT